MDLTPDSLRARLSPVAQDVRAALDQGLACLQDNRVRTGLRPDPWYDSHTIRVGARQHLEDQAEVDSVEWSLDSTVPNSGIHLNLASTAIRLAHGTLSDVPAPGRNRSRQRFWSQSGVMHRQLQLPIDTDTCEPDTHDDGPLNVLLLWEYSPAFEVSLIAAVPDGNWDFKGTPKLSGYASLDDITFGAFVGDDDEGEDLVVRLEDADDDEASGTD
jgi:hypothetical protein